MSFVSLLLYRDTFLVVFSLLKPSKPHVASISKETRYRTLVEKHEMNTVVRST